ncbi:MAG TPA: helix-turn-helix transcriptional regulator [Micromonosporaceae bacterium]|nr:helix-turn-helix transcriptional regulator [Micromonosporaceae bacterium]
MADSKELPRDIGGFIRGLRHNAKISLRQLAEQAGVSNPYLSQIERGLRRPSAEVLQQLASALRVSTPVMYLRAGLLDDKDGQGVLAAIAADDHLTMAQKQTLSQIYETFRRENVRPPEPAAPQEPAEPSPEPGAAEAAAEAVLESVAVTETDAAPAPQGSGTNDRSVSKTAHNTAAERVAVTAEKTVDEEEKS